MPARGWDVACGEEWTYRFLAVAHAWALTETAAVERLATHVMDVVAIDARAAVELGSAPQAPDPSTAEVRAWARGAGLVVPDRGRLRPRVWDAWRAVQH